MNFRTRKAFLLASASAYVLAGCITLQRAGY